MSVFFYEPFYVFDRFFDEAFNTRIAKNMNQLQHRNGDSSGNLIKTSKPRMDVHEDAEKNVVTASFELPGFKKEDVNIDVRDNRLYISAEHKNQTEHEQDSYVVRERGFGKISRALPLPQGINAGDIKASMEDGVLTVTFPKTTPELAPRKISIA